MKSSNIWRIRTISIIIVAFATVLIVNLYMVQIVKGKIYSSKADRQYVKPAGIVFDRGSIFFQSKDGTLVSAATIKEGFILALNPKNFKQSPDEIYLRLNKIVPLDKENFMAKANKKDDPYEEVVKHLDKELGPKIIAENIPGVILAKENWRVYPGDRLASHAIGITGFKGDQVAGRYGLESYYEDVLSHKTDNAYINFFAEIFADINSTVIKGKNLEGDLVTSIEPEVEKTLESKMAETMKKWKSDEIGGIIINPQNGEIYAMESLPNFNPNNVKDEKDVRVFSNPLVENTYEMGSIIKALTMAAGLDFGAVTAKTTFFDKGYIELDGKKIQNADKVGHGTVDMQTVLNKSMNTGVSFVVGKMGKENFAKYMFDYDLGEFSNIDQPNEAKGQMANLKVTRDVEYATASFGQGIAMSPIETVRALSALANGGTLITPHIVKRIDYTVGTSKDINPGLGKRVLKEETSKEITRMLVGVVDDALLHGKVKMDRYRIAAKTGTAQIADPATKRYYEDKFLHTFFGYFPAYDPKFLIFLYQKNPKGAEFSSETLTYPFIDLVKFLINYYEIPPDR